MPGSVVARAISKSFAAVQVLDGVSLTGRRPRPRRDRRAERHRQVDPAARPRRRRASPMRPGHPRTAPPGTCRRSWTRFAGETLRAHLARRTGVARRGGATWTPSPHGSPPSPGSPAPTPSARPLPGARRRRPRRACRAPSRARSGSVGGSSGRSPALSGGEAARASLAGILLARFDVLPARRADERPRLRRPRPPRALPRRARRWPSSLVSHDRAFLDRDGDARRRDRGRYAPGARVRRRLERVRAGARARARPSTRAPRRGYGQRARPLGSLLRDRRERGPPLGGEPARKATGGATGGRRTPCAARCGRRSATSSGLDDVAKPVEPWRAAS